jgi:hypothetical protein
MRTNQPITETFDQWYFHDGYLCTPQGDRFSPECIRACFFYRQMREVSHLLNWRPVEAGQDLLMQDLTDSVRLRRVEDIASSSPAWQGQRRETRACPPLGDRELLALLTDRLAGDSSAVQPVVFHD